MPFIGHRLFGMGQLQIKLLSHLGASAARSTGLSGAAEVTMSNQNPDQTCVDQLPVLGHVQTVRLAGHCG